MIPKSSIGLLFLFLSVITLAQTDEIRKRQRAIFIYNVTRQITWPNEFDTFRIGVMGNDDVLQELGKMSEAGRTVNGKPMAIRRINAVEQAEGFQLIFLRKELGFNITKVLEKVAATNTLVISEGYDFHSSMINMILVDNNFQFEINEDLLLIENFEINTSFRKMAISSSQRWQSLYEDSETSLKEEKEKLAQKEALIREQEEKISEQVEALSGKTSEVAQLKGEYRLLEEKNKLQELLYTEKTEALEELSKQFDIQAAEIEKRQIETLELDEKISEQRAIMQQQEEQIVAQSATLDVQSKKLNYQQNLVILFVIIFALIIVAAVLLRRRYQEKQRMNVLLAERNEAIESKSKELERFAYIASHDLQEPLNTIMGWIQVIDGSKLDEAGEESLKQINAASMRMKFLIQGLLEYSKLGSEAQFNDVDCNQILQKVEANLSKVISESSATIKKTHLPTILGHELKLSMLFQNLLSNAIKFRKDEEPVLIEIAAQQHSPKGWLFSVRDNGIGIAEQHQDKVFDIFHREHGRSKYEGTGIGLSHVQKIVEMHDGNIWLESTLGEGTTFYFTLGLSS